MGKWKQRLEWVRTGPHVLTSALPQVVDLDAAWPSDLQGHGARRVTTVLWCQNKMGLPRTEFHAQGGDETCGPGKTWSLALGSLTIDGAHSLELGARMFNCNRNLGFGSGILIVQKITLEKAPELRGPKGNSSLAARFGTSVNLAPSPKMDNLRPNI